MRQSLPRTDDIDRYRRDESSAVAALTRRCEALEQRLAAGGGRESPAESQRPRDSPRSASPPESAAPGTPPGARATSPKDTTAPTEPSSRAAASSNASDGGSSGGDVVLAAGERRLAELLERQAEPPGPGGVDGLQGIEEDEAESTLVSVGIALRQPAASPRPAFAWRI